MVAVKLALGGESFLMDPRYVYFHIQSVFKTKRSRGDAEFADGLAPLLNPQPKPSKLAGEQERLAWQLGCNWHRERHPLRLTPSFKLADPTAVHVSILQYHGTLPPVTNGEGT